MLTMTESYFQFPALMADYHDPPDTKEGIEELCPVCGDKVSGYHYGLLTCESCKGFFKRTVQNKKVYTCVGDRSCHIDKSQRKRCPYCRFQKCLDVGMKLEAVRADRMRGGRNKFGPMYKRDRARKLQMLRNVKPYNRPACQLQVHSPSSYPSPQPYVDIKSEPGVQMIQIPQLSSTNSPEPLSIMPSPPISDQLSPLQPVNNNMDSKPWISYQASISPKLVNYEATSSPQISQIIWDLQSSSIDDKQWQSNLFTLLQSQTYNQCEVDLFELMCKVIDQSLFAQVDWARNTILFKELKVDDQMKLLQHSWSDLLILDHIFHRLRNNLPKETTLPNGQKFDLYSLSLLGLVNMSERLHSLTLKLQELKFDRNDYLCLKFLLLLSPDVRGLVNQHLVEEAHENVRSALMEYCLSFYPQIQDKFGQLLQRLPELRLISLRGEEFLYFKHLNGSVSTQTLLMEMLHAKRK